MDNTTDVTTLMVTGIRQPRGVDSIVLFEASDGEITYLVAIEHRPASAIAERMAEVRQTASGEPVFIERPEDWQVVGSWPTAEDIPGPLDPLQVGRCSHGDPRGCYLHGPEPRHQPAGRMGTLNVDGNPSTTRDSWKGARCPVP
jgi:hypothetical protein